MALFDFLKKKQKEEKAPVIPTPEWEYGKTVPISGENSNSSTPPKPSCKKEYTITFRDAGSGRCLTDVFPEDMELSIIVNRLKEEGILSFPEDYLYIPGVMHINTYGTPVRMIDGLHSGMTVVLEARGAFLWKRKSENVYKAYPLTFYKMVDNVCIERIDYIGYGFEKPDDIILRMKREKVLSFMYQYSIYYWPDENGKILTPESGSFPYRPVPLCLFDPDPGRVMILKQHEYQPPLPSPQDDFPPAPMYGCPSAVTPEQEALLKRRCVDILSWE